MLSSPKDGSNIWLKMGMMRQVRSIIFPDQNVNIPKGQTQYDDLLEAKEVENFFKL